MNLTFFDQFMSPQTLGIPLIILALLAPSLMLPTQNNRWLTNRLSTLQLWAINLFTKQLMMPINKTGHKWSITLTSLMAMLLMINLLGLLPYTFTPTTQLSMNMGLAIPMWMATVLTGLRNQPTTSLGHLLPEGTPTPLIPILIMIETISLFIRPLALGVRLTANLTAGHLLIQLTSTAVLALLSMTMTLSILTMTILFLLTILELAVAMIQAYVFVLLLSLYLQENI
ncbi:ATP synthase F0 subunit 6 (mitochondrion) [Chelonoidis abingdonii]|uniref:ATP synthase subunit a n=2 Tax=Chelonoidis nigra species complex TaxID=1137846 RepID=A0A7L8DE27_CHEAB|nr:ATP synthase F0 subunit 6 [Chelonoidis abingdonii]YP_009944940.1 ATP synthase F0 subunit 6 [Chelonoidis hoodensis]QOD98510.1 ATP synthase F0 subunit 6 [Chelonoidis abingdonii]QOD98588.1 ATP synthase F0 subunit 6 [Chelonoidis hoodensis]USH90327.1 ATP synthase F0 subunit 6 [Chelonoidis abingdonii]USH90457.1 ATP synthase F0 subunit 6 [Chelonoidis hoodensis]USH90470.1 ATP synthase F0 subunit 6 [Chelonoidis hoodensis]